MKIYYAHCKSIYGTPQEERDIALLKSLGFKVLNPNEPKYQEACRLHFEFETNPMRFWEELMESCDGVAFRSLPSGPLPAGVAREVQRARDIGSPVIELPSFCFRDFMEVEPTRQYMREIGQR